MGAPLTFLFTDLENSTSLWEQFPEAMRQALARHDALMQKTIESHHGRIVKTTGDGVLAVFDSAADGIAAGLAGQRAIAAESWPEATGPLKVRMGLHTGESQERDGDYFGPTLNRAARVMGLAYGGQILLSETTQKLLQGQLPPQMSLSDLGEHRLKGIASPVQIFQLGHPDLVAEFPPLKSLSTFKHNLPIQISSFVGREKELANIKRLLAQSRLLTLLGPGGTGKTRLMLQAAEEVIDDYANGVWLVELAPLTDPDFIIERVATVLNVQEQPGYPLLDTLTATLRRKELLLLLDNVEHLVRESAELAEHLLRNCPSIKILVTGRESLFIEGETTLQIPSLSLPGIKGDVALEEIRASEAVQLFLARAQAVRPEFDITTQNAPNIAEVVRRLDGIPLALELAAARLRMMSVEQIADRLNDRFRLLTGGRRTALPRQQTLQALIDWSWDLLEEAERILLRRLSVFSGGWTLEAAQAVASDDQLDEFDVFDKLEQLINKSLVNVEQLPNGEVRYNMLESIHQYARDRLFEAGEGEAIRNRHAEYFVAFGEHASKALEGPDMLVWLERLLQDADNANAVRDWALESRLDLALRMTGVSNLLLRYWFFSPEGKHWLEQVVGQTRIHPEVESNAEYQRGLARAVIALGAATFSRGETTKARAILEEGIALAQKAGLIEQRVFGLNMLLIVLLNLGDFETAESLAEDVLALSRKHSLDFLYFMALDTFSSIFARQGKYEQAQAYGGKAVQLAQQSGNPWLKAMAAFMNGQFEKNRGNWAVAKDSFSQAAELFEAVRDTGFLRISQSEVGHIKRLMGDYAGAEEVYRPIIIAFQEYGNTAAIAHQLECFGEIAAFQDRPIRAAKLLGAAQALRESLDSIRLPHEQADFDQALTQLAASIGETKRDAAMAEGKMLSLDDAVTLALEGTE